MKIIKINCFFVKRSILYIIIISVLSFLIFDLYTKSALKGLTNDIVFYEIKSVTSYASQFSRYIQITSEHANRFNYEKYNVYAFKTGENAKKEIARAMETLVSRNDIYFQAMWIGPDGKEIVRVKKNKDGTLTTSLDNLQNKMNMYFIKKGLTLKTGEVYISKVDTNVEYNKLQKTEIKTLSISSKIPNYKNNGIIVIILDVTKIIQNINYKTDIYKRVSIYDSSGNIVFPANENFLFNDNLHKKDIYNHIKNLDDGVYKTKYGIFIWHKFHPENLPSININDDDWIFISYITNSRINMYYNKIISTSFIYGFVIYILLFIMVIFAAYMQTKNRESILLLAEKKQEAEQASQAKGDFVANMSHEIRTPMNAIIGLLDVLRDSKLSKNQLDLTRKVQNAAHALLAILNDILEFSKIEAGRLTLVNDTMRLDDIFSKVSDLFSVAASLKGVEIIFSYGSHVPAYVVGDAQRLTQVLSNLVGNAVKFTNHGTITVSISVVEKLPEQIRLAFSVRDTGIGMSGEQIRRIFTPFMQADNSTSRKYGGTGLGLAISQNLVRLMDGEISVVSRPAAGSEFFFSAVFGIAENAYYIAPKNMIHKRILVVDENAEIRNGLKNILREWQFDVSMVRNADTAISTLREYAKRNMPFDFVMLDSKTLGNAAEDFIGQLHASQDAGDIRTVRIIYVIQAHQSMEYAEHLDVWLVMKKPLLESPLFNALSTASNDAKSPYLYGKKEGKTLREKAATIRGTKILLVEDNELNQEVATALLRKMGLNVEIAGNGQEAVDMVRDQSYDVILMDLQMPVMDGFEASRHIRESETGKKIPIIAMTAAVFDKDREAAIATGMNDHIGKPIDVDHLLNCLIRWCKPAAPEAAPGPDADADADADAEENNPAQDATGIPDDLPGFDIPAARQRLQDDDALLLSLLRRFISEYEGWETTIENAVSSGDTATAQRLVHTLKGAAGTIGAVHLQGLAAKTEEEIKDGKNPDTDTLITLLQDTLKILTKNLPQEAENRPDGPFQPDQALPLLQKISEALDRHAVIKDADLAALRTAFGEKAADASVTGLLSCIDKFDYEGAKAAITTVFKNAEAWAEECS